MRPLSLVQFMLLCSLAGCSTGDHEPPAPPLTCNRAESFEDHAADGGTIVVGTIVEVRDEPVPPDIYALEECEALRDEVRLISLDVETTYGRNGETQETVWVGPLARVSEVRTGARLALGYWHVSELTLRETVASRIVTSVQLFGEDICDESDFQQSLDSISRFGEQPSDPPVEWRELLVEPLTNEVCSGAS